MSRHLAYRYQTGVKARLKSEWSAMVESLKQELSAAVVGMLVHERAPTLDSP